MLNIFVIPRPNILKFCTFALGTLIKESVKFGGTRFFLTKVTNFSSREDDDVPQLSAETFSALSEFYQEQVQLRTYFNNN